MNVTRAQEIIEAKEKIEVQYQGKPVWIDGVDGRTATARIHPEENPNDSMTVDVDQLKER